MRTDTPASSAWTPVSLAGRDGGLSYRQAREAPCLSCATSPCCTYLLLSSIEFNTVMDVDHALYLLNFEGIVLALGAGAGAAQVYLYQPCGFLDGESGLCTVHSTPRQPSVCVHYNAQSCAYRHSFTTDLDPQHPLLDYQRMAWLADRLVFDDERRVVGTPAWDEVLAGFRQLPLVRRAAPVPGPDPVVEAWRSIVLSEKGSAERTPVHHYGDPEVSDPCQGCGAWCCRVLVFNRGLPENASQLEFLRYCLGFPAVEVGVSSDSWAVLVHTTCRHLDGNRCSVFGTDQRPLKCGDYDALSCAYRAHFGAPRPDDIVRVRLDQFKVVADSLVFDDLGRVVGIPPVAVLRDRLENGERRRAATNQNMLIEISE